MDDDLVDSVLGMVGSTRNLTNGSVRKLFAVLAKKNPTKEDWWKGWTESCDLRHPIAHKGKGATAAQAVACIESAKNYIDYMADAAKPSP